MKKTYSEKLKDPRWQKKRLEALQRDEFRCQICFDPTKTLHVHHLAYIRGKEPWDYSDNHLQTLCCDCHEEMTSFLPIIMPQLETALKLQLKDSFILRCAQETFEQYEDLHGIIYLLWELKDRQSEVHEALAKMFRKE